MLKELNFYFQMGVTLRGKLAQLLAVDVQKTRV
jgi:hypothetical protein